MAEQKTPERQLETVTVKGKEFQRDKKTGAIVLSFPKTAMKTEDEAAHDADKAKEKEKAKPNANTDT